MIYKTTTPCSNAGTLGAASRPSSQERAVPINSGVLVACFFSGTLDSTPLWPGPRRESSAHPSYAATLEVTIRKPIERERGPQKWESPKQGALIQYRPHGIGFLLEGHPRKGQGAKWLGGLGSRERVHILPI